MNAFTSGSWGQESEVKGLFVHLVQTSSRARLHEDAVDDGVFHHGEVGGDLLILLGQGEEGRGEQKEGDQGQSHLWQRGNEQKIMRPCVCESKFLSYQMQSV